MPTRLKIQLLFSSFFKIFHSLLCSIKWFATPAVHSSTISCISLHHNLSCTQSYCLKETSFVDSFKLVKLSLTPSDHISTNKGNSFFNFNNSSRKTDFLFSLIIKNLYCHAAEKNLSADSAGEKSLWQTRKSRKEDLLYCLLSLKTFYYSSTLAVT